MDIEKVNAVLNKALVMIKEGESGDLQDLLMAEGFGDDGDDAEATPMEAFIDAVVDHVSEETDAEDQAIIEALIAVAGEMANRDQLPDLFGMEDPSDLDEEKWLEAVRDSNLVEGALHYIQAAPSD